MAASMAFSVTRSIRTRISLPHKSRQRRSLRSDTALEAIARASEVRTPFIALYNYPSFSGALSALFAHLFHSRLSFPCLVLPFSSVLSLRIDDLRLIGIEKCYLLDFVGPPGFAMQLSRTTNCEVICFDHRKSTLKTIQSPEAFLEKVIFHVDMERSSSRAVYEYFSSELKQNQAVRADGNSHLSDELGKELSLRSSAAGLRPIGAVIYMQRNNLKMCLRSVDSSADTSEIAKAYGGGGRPSSSSFIIRMDEYNQWLSVC